MKRLELFYDCGPYSHGEVEECLLDAKMRTSDGRTIKQAIKDFAFTHAVPAGDIEVKIWEEE